MIQSLSDRRLTNELPANNDQRNRTRRVPPQLCDRGVTGRQQGRRLDMLSNLDNTEDQYTTDYSSCYKILPDDARTPQLRTCAVDFSK